MVMAMAMACVDSNSARASFSIQSCVAMLQQNKRFAREEGLKGLIEALEGFVRTDAYVYKQAMDRCFHFLQTGSAKERKDAYRAIGLYALTVGPNNNAVSEQTILDRLFNLAPLAGMVPSSPSDADRAVAAIDCLAAATLACAKLSWEAGRTLKAIWEVIEQPGTAAIPQVMAAAVSAWTVVLPAARDTDEAMAITPFVLIPKLLRANEPDVRMAAGEALAVCIELDIRPREPKIPSYYYYNTKPPVPEPDERPGFESRVSELAFGQQNARKKKANAGEMNLFRQIDDFLKKNELHLHGLLTKNKQRPAESWSSGGFAVKVSKWAKLVQLNFLKFYIGDGFYTHFRLNLPLFRYSFGLTRDDGGRPDKEDLPDHEKKQSRKDRDKHKTKAIRRDLRDKMQY